MDERVTAHVFLELAKANNRLALLEALEKEVPVLSGTHSSRLRLSRKITNARSLAQSWARAYALTETGAFDTAGALKRLAEDSASLVAGLDKEFPPTAACGGCLHASHSGGVCTVAVMVGTDHEQDCGCES